MINTRAPDGANKLKAFVIDVKVGTVTGSIGVCSRQAPTVTRANGNVRGAAYLAWPQLERVGFSIERESQLPAPCPPGTTCTLGPDLIGCWCWLCGIVRRQRLVPCLTNLAVSTALQPHPAHCFAASNTPRVLSRNQSLFSDLNSKSLKSFDTGTSLIPCHVHCSEKSNY